MQYTYENNGKIFPRHIYEKLFCTHPKVYAIWEYGSMPAQLGDNTVWYNLAIMLSDFTIKEFKGEKPEEVKFECEVFLETL